jgi:hypothetical protein
MMEILALLVLKILNVATGNNDGLEDTNVDQNATNQKVTG